MTTNIPEMNNSLSILYVEDNQQNQKLVQSIIAEKSQHQLQLADNGQSGLEAAASLQPDLILLDINLPDMTGYDFIRKLKSDNLTHSIPVIAITANASNAHISQIKQEDFFGYITKPFDINEFMDLVNSTIKI